MRGSSRCLSSLLAGVIVFVLVVSSITMATKYLREESGVARVRVAEERLQFSKVVVNKPAIVKRGDGSIGVVGFDASRVVHVLIVLGDSNPRCLDPRTVVTVVNQSYFLLGEEACNALDNGGKVLLLLKGGGVIELDGPVSSLSPPESSSSSGSQESIVRQDPAVYAMLSKIVSPSLYSSIVSRYEVLDYAQIVLPKYVLGESPYGEASGSHLYWEDPWGQSHWHWNTLSADITSNLLILVHNKLFFRIKIALDPNNSQEYCCAEPVLSLEITPTGEYGSYKLLFVYDQSTGENDAGIYTSAPCAYYGWWSADEQWTYPRNLWENKFIMLNGKTGYYIITDKLGFYGKEHVYGNYGTGRYWISFEKLFYTNTQQTQKYNCLYVFALKEKQR